MRSLGRLGLVLSIAGLATTASAAPDSRVALPADDLNAAQMDRAIPVEQAPPIRGGWARDGWSDEAGSGLRGAAHAEDFHNGRADADGPPPREWRDRGDRAMRQDGPPGEWRRQTWDGGRGSAFAYRRGGRLPAVFGSSIYAVRDWQGYDLAPPGPGRRWVRYYDDAVLLDGRGYILDAVPAIGWDEDRPDRDFGPGPDHGNGRYHHGNMGRRPDGPRIDHRGPGPAPQVYYGPGGATTIVITTAPSVTTTTTTTTESYVTHKRVWRPASTRLVQIKPARTVQTKHARTVQTKPAR